MATCYYPSFDVIRIAADGERIALPGETVSVYNVTAASSLGTLISDADYGIIDSGSFTATLFDVIEISHDTYPLTCRFTLQATADDAFTAVENDISAYIAENLYTDRTESKVARMYIVDLDNTSRQPEYATEIKPGVESKIHIPQTSTAQNLRLALVSESIEGQFSTSDIKTAAEYFDITIPAVVSLTNPITLFDHFTDATAATTSLTTLWLDQIDAGTLATNGDKITVEYNGIFDATTGEKNIYFKFNGSTLFDSGTVAENGTHWKMNVTLIRVSNTVIRSAVHFETSNPFTPVYTELTGLTLDATDYDVSLVVNCVDNAGDVIAKTGYGLFIPAATTNQNWLLDENGEVILDENGDQIEAG